MTDYIQDLKDVIRRLHGAEATHIESLPVRESQEGLAVWEGVVEVFDLVDHPTAHRVYAWAQDTDDPKNPRRYLTVLHQHPIKSAHDAVRSALVRESRSLSQTQGGQEPAAKRAF